MLVEQRDRDPLRNPIPLVTPIPLTTYVCSTVVGPLSQGLTVYLCRNDVLEILRSSIGHP